MEETKEKVKKNERKVKENKNGKHKAKLTVGDIIFRVLILVVIFFIVVISYVFYLDFIVENTQNMKNVNYTIVKYKN